MSTVPIRNADGQKEQIVTDALDTLDGVAVTGDPEVQVVKVAFGTTGAARQVDGSNPLPVGVQFPATQNVDQRVSGTWGYRAGTSGTPDLTGRRVLAITAVGGASGGTIEINGGDDIVIASGQSFTVVPRGVLTAPTIVFTGTSAYFVETVA